MTVEVIFEALKDFAAASLIGDLLFPHCSMVVQSQ
jgi:hypothetical protein